MTFLAALRGKVGLVDHHLAFPVHHEHGAEPGEADRTPCRAEYEVTAGDSQHDRKGIDWTLGLKAQVKDRIESVRSPAGFAHSRLAHAPLEDEMLELVFLQLDPTVGQAVP